MDLARQHEKPKTITVLICSCNKTDDIAFHMFSSVNLYANTDELDIYMGSDIQNENVKFDYKFIDTPQSGWKSETIFQLKYIKEHNPEVNRVLLLLDDFILSKKVDITRLAAIQNATERSGIKYLSLKPSSDSIFLKLRNLFKSALLIQGVRYFTIRNDHPYYFSLQAAFWDIDYLIKSIERSSNIWEFENLKTDGTPHCSVLAKAMHYKHIVEKGEWDFNAKSFCLSKIGFFNPGTRKFRKGSVRLFLKIYSRKITFMIFGYGIKRIRERVKLG